MVGVSGISEGVVLVGKKRNAEEFDVEDQEKGMSKRVYQFLSLRFSNVEPVIGGAMHFRRY